jgi:hypothetical protein
VLYVISDSDSTMSVATAFSFRYLGVVGLFATVFLVSVRGSGAVRQGKVGSTSADLYLKRLIFLYCLFVFVTLCVCSYRCFFFCCVLALDF